MTSSPHTATQHLDEAAALIAEFRTRWDAIVELDPVATSLEVTADGHGRISCSFRWGAGEREALSTLCHGIVSHLRAGLDAAIMEAVAALAAPYSSPRPGGKRFFPIADSWETFTDLLSQSCLDGVLTTQYHLVAAVQPFQPVADGEPAARYRTALSRLAVWDQALGRGDLLDAWVTAIAPKIITKDGHLIVDQVRRHPPAPLRGQSIIATFLVPGYTPGDIVRGLPGSYVDVALTAEFDPSDENDTFLHRLQTTYQDLSRLVLLFGTLTTMQQQPTSSSDIGRADEAEWHEVGEGGHVWSAAQLETLHASDSGVATVVGEASLTLVVATLEGTFERVIPKASPLRPSTRIGVAAEIAISDAAATWGLPDFVFTPVIERKGAGVREIGDGLVVVGDIGAIVQSKAREGTPSSPQRERSWALKQITHGARQAEGSARRLRREPATFQNGRGHHFAVAGADVRWVGVVVLDHSELPTNIVPPEEDRTLPIVVLLRRDWEFLFDQLRSTHAVLSYLLRVAGTPIALGSEPERYYELALKDERTEPGELDPRLNNLGHVDSRPILPTRPAAADDNAYGLVRIMLEDLATITLPDDQILARQRLLASIDSLPVAYRTDLGVFLLDAFNALPGSTAPGDFPKFAFRTFVAAEDRDQIGFGVSSDSGSQVREIFQSWVELRHHERVVRLGGADDLTTIGVLLTPRPDRLRLWDTTMVAFKGDPQLSPERVAALAALWNDAETSPQANPHG